MGKVKIVIVEDEFVIAEDIQMQLLQAGYDVLRTFDSAEAALPFFLSETPDIGLVDIQLLGAMDGIRLVEQIQAKLSIPIIYITANSDSTTYDRARKTKPHAFLIKPFSNFNLFAAIDLALYHFSLEQSPERIEKAVVKEYSDEPFLVNQCLFIRISGKHKKIYANDLLFVEASGSYVHIQTKTERYTLSQNLAHFQKKTPLPNLLRIHRSYLILLERIDSFDESFVYIEKHKLPIGENYKSEFLARIHCL